MFAKRVEFGATYFHNNINNLITINDAGTSYVNIGKATTYGVESFVAYAPWTPLNLARRLHLHDRQDDILAPGTAAAAQAQGEL